MKTKTKKVVAKKIIIPAKYIKAVENGIAFLDITLGRREWLSRMDMKDFDIIDAGTCVAGNVWKDAYRPKNDDDDDDSEDGYENFGHAMRLLNQNDPEGERFGFYSGDPKGFQYLQDIWVRVINKMKKQARIK